MILTVCSITIGMIGAQLKRPIHKLLCCVPLHPFRNLFDNNIIFLGNIIYTLFHMDTYI